jgi:Domain of unknown function (DUF4388)
VKLEGSLDAFGLPDIFQLLSLTKKTGGLHLRSGASIGVVYFAGGAVTGADADLARQTLARRLVGGGTVSDEALAKAVTRAQKDGIGVGRALLDAGAVDPDLLRDAAAEVACDAVFDLLSWPEGDFAFSADAVNPDDVGMALPTEQVVSEAGSRQKSLDSAADAISSPDLVLAVPMLLAGDPELTRTEWTLVAMADGGRSVADIVDLTGQSYYTVVPSLADLVRRGLLEVQTEASDQVGAIRRRLDLLAVLEGPAAERPTVTTPAAAVRVPVVEPAPPVLAPEPVPAAPPAALDTSDLDDLQDASDEDDEDDEDLEDVPELVSTIGGPHVPDGVVPPRPEPFLARRQPEHPEVGQPVPGTQRPAFGSSLPAAARATSGSVFSAQPSSGGDAPRAGMGQGTGGGVGGVNGSAAMAADPESAALIERDPSVNRSLLLRLIAGVRGL